MNKKNGNKNKNKLEETASMGATSSGGIATVVGTLNYPLQKRLPPTNLFGYEEVDQDGKPKSGKKKDQKGN